MRLFQRSSRTDLRLLKKAINRLFKIIGFIGVSDGKQDAEGGVVRQHAEAFMFYSRKGGEISFEAWAASKGFAP